MATKRMLVDASHPEETRIVVTSGNRLDEFDFESATRRQLRGNIYLAKVTRVEPSLQAAFVDYGGNRHGFLAFSEIHPDYYQIPVADREALLRAEAEAVAISSARIAEAEKEDPAQTAQITEDPEDGAASPDDEASDTSAQYQDPDAQDPDAQDENAEPDQAISGPQDGDANEETETSGELDAAPDAEPATDIGAELETIVDSDAADDDNFDDLGGGEGEDLLEQRRKLIRRYKIQEVIKRRQVLLVQVVKEERGNKGAALTTYLSLAGRYSVLMPNTARGGGISRKITSAADRKRLKQIAGDLTVPAGMGVILRTAGASRTKAEIKRDFEYLSRLWENVRELTMKSSAPSLVYEEGSLIKRTIRDLYNKEIAEVLVAGDEAYREAKDFMRLIMPSHAKSVQAYKEDQHLFTRYNVESQLDSMFSPQVTLPSGGYLVINPTEALVSIDVNSGRATKEHNIEATALQTNLEAADEVARQLRLRDLAGLIVIDFIDMTERRSIRNVEKRMKDALKNDRARIQVGRISHFGLLEMSRQRMRFGVLESSTAACPTCEGTGIVRSVESSAIMVMRAIEDHVVRRPGQSVEVRMASDAALYILNAKRALLIDLEKRLNLIITISADHAMSGSQFSIDKSAARPAQASVAQAVVSMENTQIEETEDSALEVPESEARSNNAEQPSRKRRRRKPGNSSQNSTQAASTENTEPAETEGQAASAPETSGDGEQDDQPRKRRRRGRRGGRRNRRNAGNETEMAQADQANAAEAGPEQAPDAIPQNAGDTKATQTPAEPVAAAPDQDASNTPGVEQSDAVASEPARKAEVGAASEVDANAEKPKKPARRRARKPSTKSAKPNGAAQASDASDTPADAPAATPAPEAKSETIAQPLPESAKDSAPKTAEPAPRAVKPLVDEGVIVSTSSDQEDKKPKRRGWWSLK